SLGQKRTKDAKILSGHGLLERFNGSFKNRLTRAQIKDFQYGARHESEIEPARGGFKNISLVGASTLAKIFFAASDHIEHADFSRFDYRHKHLAAVKLVHAATGFYAPMGTGLNECKHRSGFFAGQGGRIQFVVMSAREFGQMGLYGGPLRAAHFHEGRR